MKMILLTLLTIIILAVLVKAATINIGEGLSESFIKTIKADNTTHADTTSYVIGEHWVNETLEVGNQTFETSNEDIELRLLSDSNKHSYLYLMESSIFGFRLWYDGSGTNTFKFDAIDNEVVRPQIWFNRDTADIDFFANTNMNDNNISGVQCLELNEEQICSWDSVNVSIGDINITGGVGESWVNESGDTMTGDLNMSGNDLILGDNSYLNIEGTNPVWRFDAGNDFLAYDTPSDYLELVIGSASVFEAWSNIFNLYVNLYMPDWNITSNYFIGNGSQLTSLTHSLQDAYDDGSVIIGNVNITELTVKNISSPYVNKSYIFFQSDGSIGITLDPIIPVVQAQEEQEPEQEKVTWENNCEVRCENPSKIIGIGETSLEWNIEKTGDEINLDVDYTILSDTSTEFCIDYEDKVKYESSLTNKVRDVKNIPITEMKGTDKFSINKADIDLSSTTEVSDEQCFIVNYNKLELGMEFKIGWDTVIITSTDTAGSTQKSPNENIVQDSSGNLFIVFEGNESDISFANSSDGSGGVNWDVRNITGETASLIGLIIDSNDIMTIYFSNSESDFAMINSTDGGKTWTSPFEVYDATSDSSNSCVYDMNDIAHCCVAAVGRLYYLNSTTWNSPTAVNTNTLDDTDDCDIETDSNGCIYIVGRGSDDDEIDIWSPCLDGWGDANRVNIHASNLDQPPTMAIDNNNNIYITFWESSDLWFANSSTGGATWSSKEIDSEDSAVPDISVDSDGNIYILYIESLSSVKFNLYLANSSDGSSGLNWDNRTVLNDSSYYPSIADTNYPKTNRITNTLHYVYLSNVSNFIVYDSFVISEVADEIAPVVNLIAPSNNTLYTTDNSIDFNYSCNDAVGVVNASLYINDVYNKSNDGTANFTNTAVGNGNYNWSINCSDAVPNWGYSGFFNLTVDYTAPPPPANPTVTSTLVAPADASEDTDGDVVFNCSATATNSILTNISFYHNISGTWGVNKTNNVGGTSNKTNFTINDIPDTTNLIWNCLASNNETNTSFASANWSLTINISVPPPPILKIPKFFVQNLSGVKQWWVNSIGNMWLRGILNVTGNGYFGGGYGNTGATIYDNGNISMDGDLNVDNNLYIGKNITPNLNNLSWLGNNESIFQEVHAWHIHSDSYLSASAMKFTVTNSFPFEWYFNSELLMNLTPDGDLNLKKNFTAGYADFKTKAAKYHKNGFIDTPDTNWHNMTWNITVDTETTSGFELVGNDTIQSNFDGIIGFDFCLHPKNNGAGGTEMGVLTRLIVDGVEIRCSQGFDTQTRKNGYGSDLRVSGTVNVTEGSEIRLEYKVDNTDLDFEGNSGFDRPVAATIELEKISDLE